MQKKKKPLEKEIVNRGFLKSRKLGDLKIGIRSDFI
jgi:hypothetical protein